MTLWNLHLPSWVIQDGTLPDLFGGEVAAFAAEIETSSFAPTVSSPQANHQNDNIYDIVAQMVWAASIDLVIDVGDLPMVGAFPRSTVPAVGATARGRDTLAVSRIFSQSDSRFEPGICQRGAGQKRRLLGRCPGW